MTGRRRPRSRALAAWALTIGCAWAGGCAWGEEAAIRSRLRELAAEANKPAAEGFALVAHAATIGEFFTEDVTVELAPGAAPIHGREMLIGMVARLQPRTAAYRVALEDMDVRVAEGEGTAGAAVTVSILPLAPAPGEGPDAREYALTLTKSDGTWRIARATAVQALR